MVAGSGDPSAVNSEIEISNVEDAGGIGGEKFDAPRNLSEGDAYVDNDTTSDLGRDDNSIGYRIETALSDLLMEKNDLIHNGFKQYSILDKDAFVAELLSRCDPSNKEDQEDVMYLTAIIVLDLIGASSTKNGESNQFLGGEHFQEMVHQIRIGSECVDGLVEQALEKEDAGGGERL
ncbi:hypothetical protein LTR86_003218 [Recurvomyces mirabilis]|nr:hypothetical protein LTR86_003218 [Recurvomyces mirabilis]